MSEHRFTLDNTSAAVAPAAVRPPHYLHNLRYRKPTEATRTSPEGHTLRALSDLTVVTCACGLTTPALPNDEARLVYEEHRNEIRDEMA
ncbi:MULTISPECIES: hypothetical protein [unclassified Streptomyces]|uniref:hypothetical protein n=1 Tax=unclassified Streptomyces TaxID=2593676 RepID=UPI00061F8CF8|nr:MULTISPECIES: hypothetical protein [unclassified Streptomyces]KJY34588.1 hypothetical protein VR46_32555 [Streptomyces sp. NRRL S-444]TDU80446.1 hypothetical protein EDD91_7299 [Streptomyces sp. KS 21]THA39824.1 hypothetical protein E6W17_09630 [Streptomyces sp. A1547]